MKLWQRFKAWLAFNKRPQLDTQLFQETDRAGHPEGYWVARGNQLKAQCFNGPLAVCAWVEDKECLRTCSPRTCTSLRLPEPGVLQAALAARSRRNRVR